MSRVRERWLPNAVGFERSLLTIEQAGHLTKVCQEARLALDTALERSLDEDALQGKFLVNAEDLARAVRARYIGSVGATMRELPPEARDHWSEFIAMGVPEFDREELSGIGPGAISLLGVADPNAVSADIAGRRTDVAPYIVYGVDEIGYLGPPTRHDDVEHPRHGLIRCNVPFPYGAGWGIICNRQVCRSECYWELLELERELLSWSLPYRQAVLGAVASVREIVVEARLAHHAYSTGERTMTPKQGQELEHNRDRTVRNAKRVIRRANRNHELPKGLLGEWKAKRKALTRGFASLDGIVIATKLYGPGALLLLDAMRYASPATKRLFYDRVRAELDDPGSVPPKGLRLHP